MITVKIIILVLELIAVLVLIYYYFKKLLEANKELGTSLWGLQLMVALAVVMCLGTALVYVIIVLVDIVKTIL